MKPLISETSNNKLVFLESLRGLAALFVVLGHLKIAFFPTLDTNFHPANTDISAASPSYSWGISFLTLLISGIYPVRLFFFLSGFVLSISYFRRKDIAVLTSAALRRYPRLMLPALTSIIFAWALLQLHAYHNSEAAALMQQDAASPLYQHYPHQTLTLFQAVVQGVSGTFFSFNMDTSLNGVLWTMPIELAGSFFVFSFLALVGSIKKRFLIYVLIAVPLLHFRSQIYTLDFLLGVALSDLFVYCEIAGIKHQLSFWWAILIFSGGCLLGPLSIAYGDMEKTSYLTFSPFHLISNVPTFASFLIVGAACFSPIIRSVLEHSIISFFGRISFPLYLFHIPILGTMGCGFYIHLRKTEFSHPAAAVISSLIVLTFSILTAWCAYYSVERPSIRAAARISRFFQTL